MSISLEAKADKAYKKATLNVSVVGTTANAPYYTAPSSPTEVFASNIISQDADIPATAPTADLVDGNMWDKTGVLTVDVEKAIVMYNEVVMSSIPGSVDNSYIISSKTGVILPFNFGDGTYAAKIYENNLVGAQIPFGLNSWEFDTSGSVITFFDGKPSAITANAIGIKYWSYVGATGVNLANTAQQIKSYQLNVLLAPDDTVWDGPSETWTITHDIGTIPSVITLENATSGTIYCDEVKHADVTTTTIKVPGYLNKATGVITYEIIKLTIKS